MHDLMKEPDPREKPKDELTEAEIEKVQGGGGAVGPLYDPPSFAGPGICLAPPIWRRMAMPRARGGRKQVAA
jgi:hypothetical protein